MRSLKLDQQFPINKLIPYSGNAWWRKPLANFPSEAFGETKSCLFAFFIAYTINIFSYQCATSTAMLSEFIIKEGRESIQLTQYPVQTHCIKVHTVKHRVLSFCINTFWVTKDLRIGVNNFVVVCVQISILYHSYDKV